MTSPGRRPSTTKSQISEVAIGLFSRQGFESTSVDDIAAAAGIARRTLFRYYRSKNAIAWGDFDDHLQQMRAHLAALPAQMPIDEALRQALMSFNEVPAEHVSAHRQRMRLLLTVPALQAHSMLMYAEWRRTIAEFVAGRTGQRETDHLPQTIGWMMLGVALAAYEQWLADPGTDLLDLLADGIATLDAGLGELPVSE